MAVDVGAGQIGSWVSWTADLGTLSVAPRQRCSKGGPSLLKQAFRAESREVKVDDQHCSTAVPALISAINDGGVTAPCLA